MVAWAPIATFLIESITLLWIPAKEAAVPNLIPRARLETANQLTLITTYGLTPVAAALGLAVLDRGVRGAVRRRPARLGRSRPSSRSSSTRFSRLATALVVAFGIKEISGHRRGERASAPSRACSASSPRAGSTSARPRWSAAWCWASSARSPAAASWSAPPSSSPTRWAPVTPPSTLLFGAIFVGLALGIGLGPMIVRDMSRRRWFGMSIVLASASVMVLAFAIHLSMAHRRRGAGRRRRRHGLPGRHHAARRRGRRRGPRPGLRRRADRHPAGADPGHRADQPAGRRRRLPPARPSPTSASPSPPPGCCCSPPARSASSPGSARFGQMDDKKGVPVLADLWGSIRGRPLMPAEPFVSARRSSWSSRAARAPASPPRSTALAERAARRRAATWWSPASRAPPRSAQRIRALVLDTSGDGRAVAARRGAALRRRPGAPRGHRGPARAGPGRGGDQRPVRRLVPGLPGRRPDAAGRRGLLAVLLGHRRAQARPGGAARRRPAHRACPGWPPAAPAPTGWRPSRVAFHERVRYAFLDLAAADPKRYLVLDAVPPGRRDRRSGRSAGSRSCSADPAGIVHPRPAQGPDTSVQPELSDAELVTHGARHLMPDVFADLVGQDEAVDTRRAAASAAAVPAATPSRCAPRAAGRADADADRRRRRPTTPRRRRGRHRRPSRPAR